MRETTDKLIERLAHDAAPVKPLWPPFARASLFLAVAAVAMAAAAIFGGDVQHALSSLSNVSFTLELVGAFAAGVAAIVAAVMMSVPGRSESWLYLPLPGILLWLAAGGIDCYRYIETFGFGPPSPFASEFCFKFIVTAGVPTAVAFYLLLRQTVSIHLLSVTALGGLGSAMLAATLLQFFHAHATNPVDFGTHAVAVAMLILFAIVAGRAALRPR